MRVRSVSVRNYRSLKDVTVHLDGLTTLIGPNGSGKTSVLRALNLFSADAPPVTEGDFNDRGKDMEVCLAISCEATSAELAPHVIDGVVCLRLVYEPPGDGARRPARPEPKGMIWEMLNTDFDELRGMTKKTDVVPAIAGLKRQEIYADLPECKGVVKEWKPGFLEYERGFCRLHPDHPKVKPGYVPWDTEKIRPTDLLDIVYVPAMRDIARDAADGSGSYLGSLINMVIENAWTADADVGLAAGAGILMQDEYYGMVRARLLPALNDGLNKKSRRFARGATVEVELGGPGSRPPPLRPSITIREGGPGEPEGGRTMDIDHVGGGLQRIYLMALLETIADQKGGDGAGGAGGGGSGGGDGDRARGSRARLVMIDEPEIYQHPQRQRVILRKLGGLADPQSGMQFLLCTHSPYFVELSKIDGLRLLTKGEATSVHVATRKEIMGPILERYRTNMPNDDALNRWLDTNASHWITEGLFSRLAVIVEGIDDRNALLATAGVMGVDLNEHEISIVPAHGKPKMIPVACLFVPFGIPLYLVWDLDDGNDDGEENDGLLRLADPDNFGRHAGSRDTAIEARFSCFKTNLTTVLHGEIADNRGALERAGGWSGLLGPHQPKLEKAKHCESCTCERVEPSEALKRLLGSRDVLHDLLCRLREADEDAFDSLSTAKIVRKLVKAAQAPRPARPAREDPEGCCAAGAD